MDSVKTFFAGQNKDSTFANNQQSGLGQGLFFSGRSMQTNNGLTNGAGGNADAKMTNLHDVKRKDSDSYFYIMWRS